MCHISLHLFFWLPPRRAQTRTAKTPHARAHRTVFCLRGPRRQLRLSAHSGNGFPTPQRVAGAGAEAAGANDALLLLDAVDLDKVAVEDGGTQWRSSGLMASFCCAIMARCSSMILGVTDRMCWPFQYLTRFRFCSVDTMSSVRMLVRWLISLMLMLPRCWCSSSSSTCDQYER